MPVMTVRHAVAGGATCTESASGVAGNPDSNAGSYATRYPCVDSVRFSYALVIHRGWQ